MKRIVLFPIVLLVCGYSCFSQEIGSKELYQRSSLYNILVRHPKQRYADEIQYVYYKMPMSEKFNNHSLSIKAVSSDLVKKEKLSVVSNFLESNEVGKRLLAKWFNRDKRTGFCDTELLKERGLYNAKDWDVQLARMTVRGTSMLGDSGEELIGQTFVLANDIIYIDKEERAQKARLAFQIIGAILGAAGDIASAATGNNSSAYGDLGRTIGMLGAEISNAIAGFTVNVTTHLYKLEWNDSIAADFYQNYYIDKNTDKASRYAKYVQWGQPQNKIPLTYVGSQTVRSDKTVMRGLYKNEDVISKVVYRALDKSVVALQKNYEVFKIKTPIQSISNNTLTAKVGLKEGVSLNSKYEVLEIRRNEKGKTVYKRVGIVKPIANRIWDNRYMAIEEEADNANLNETTFAIVSGTNFAPGMLLREIKF
jgi:hypothetical protein